MLTKKAGLLFSPDQTKEDLRSRAEISPHRNSITYSKTIKKEKKHA
jgi:hypothetical protein